MKFELEEFKKQSQQGERDACFKEKQQIEIELARVLAKSQEQDARNEELNSQIRKLKEKSMEVIKANSQKIDDRDTKINEI